MEMQSITNPSLMTAMRNMRENDVNETRTIFINAMVNANYLVPAIIDPIPENNVIPEGTTISLYSVKDEDDKNFMVVFTDGEELTKWNSEIKQNIVNSFDDIKSMVLGENAGYNGFIINPSSDNIAVKNDLVERIASQIAQNNVKMEKIDNAQGNGLVAAKNVKPELLEDMKNIMSTMDNINAAYIMETMRPGMDSATKVVIVDFEGDLKMTFDSIATVANKHLSKGESIGFMPASDVVASASIVGEEPFYKK